MQKIFFKILKNLAGILRINVEYNKYYYLFITFNIKETIYIIIPYIKIPIQCKVSYQTIRLIKYLFRRRYLYGSISPP